MPVVVNPNSACERQTNSCPLGMQIRRSRGRIEVYVCIIE